jgi:hypothetical protein
MLRVVLSVVATALTLAGPAAAIPGPDPPPVRDVARRAHMRCGLYETSAAGFYCVKWKAGRPDPRLKPKIIVTPLR